MIAGSAARRPAAAASALAVLFVVGVLTSCGLDPKSSSISPERRSELQAVADKASRFSELEQQAYQRNTLLQFSAAEQDYRETLSLARELFPTDPARASYLRLHLALNKSNLGQFESAESLFDRSRQIVEELGLPSERAKPDLFYAQHQMNLKQFAKAEEIAGRAEATLDALIPTLGDGRGNLDKVGLVRRNDGALLLDQPRANIANARLSRDTSVEGAGKPLTDRERLQLQRVQALYIIARAMRAQGKSEDKIAELVARSETDLADVPESYGRWLRAEIASLRADRLSEQGKKDQAVKEIEDAIELLTQIRDGFAARGPAALQGRRAADRDRPRPGGQARPFARRSRSSAMTRRASRSSRRARSSTSCSRTPSRATSRRGTSCSC